MKRVAGLVCADFNSFALCILMAAGMTAVTGGAFAQNGAPPVPIPSGSPVPVRLGFSLFANEDLAGASLRLTGTYRYAAFNAAGLCAVGAGSGDIFNASCGASSAFFFYILPAWGVPPSAYERIRAAWPGVARMQQPIGYSTPWRNTVIGPRVLRIGPSDNQFGGNFSGAFAARDGSCRDPGTSTSLPTSMTLTALSDCPVTWGSQGFRGMHVIPDSVWLQRFQQNPTAFRWDDWKIPPSALVGTSLIGDLTTYGSFSDYGRETLALYGGVTPKGNPDQQPLERGFPLGIEVRYDAFKYDRKSLRDGVFVRWQVINNSARVWNQGIDYDSLYMGIDPGYVSPLSIYNVPSMGTQVSSQGGVSGKCGSTYPRRVLPGANEACPGTNQFKGVHAIIVLKSPIGDLRNKLLSNAASPYFAPANPKVDDTITFNHWRRGGFNQQDSWSWRRSDRALFGLMSGREDLWLDGRSATDFTASQIWSFFRYESTNGQQSAANLRYNRSVPGSIPGYGKWDYNDDGVQDTLMLPDCGINGCAKLWSDTIAGGFGTSQGGEIGNYLGVGPFSLKAGDTTEFIWYLGWEPDTAGFNRLVRNVTDAYLANFSTVSPPPLPAFTASDVQVTAVSPSDTTRTSQVRIQIRMPSQQSDPYLSRVALARLQSSDAIATEVRRLNPGIVQTVQSRMQQNLARLLVFKSCNAGRSWTDATGKCDSAATARTETVTGTTAGVGWQAFRTITADSVTGALSAHVVTDAVTPGHEYLYSFIAQTRGLADISVVYQETQDASGTVTSRKTGTLWDALAVDVDSVTSSLAATGPTTVTVYAPISVPAGTIVARVDTATRQGLATNRVAAIARSARVDGTFRMRFGNRFVLTRIVDTASGSRTTVLERQSVYARASSAPSGATVAVNFVAAADTFVSSHDITYSFPGFGGCNVCVLRTAPRSTVGSVLTFVDTISQTGYVIAKGNGAADPLFLAVSSSASLFTSIGQSVDPFEGSAYYPGFTATVTAEATNPGTRKVGSYATPTLRAQGDTLADSLVARAPHYVSFTSGGLRGSPGGVYRLHWEGDAFGPRAPFTFGTRAQMQNVVDASLDTRPVAAYTDTSSAYRAQLLSATGTGEGTFGVGARPLIRAKVPFTVTGLNGPARLVMLSRHTPGNAADSLFRNSRLFGTAGDTTRVAVPPDVWLPGDTLWMFENIALDSTATIANNSTFIVRDTTVNGRVQRLPIRVIRDVMGIKIAPQCTSNTTPTRVTCNPIAAGPNGATAYTKFSAGWEQVLDFNRPFDQNSEVALTATPTRATARPLTKGDMNTIRVVPNPYIVQSSFDDGTAAPRMLFINVPDAGTLRIYTVSGQLVRQLTWSASDLIASGDNSPHGDLSYDLRTRDGRNLVGGLYLYVITPVGPNANRTVARGKFVVIR